MGLAIMLAVLGCSSDSDSPSDIFTWDTNPKDTAPPVGSDTDPPPPSTDTDPVPDTDTTPPGQCIPFAFDGDACLEHCECFSNHCNNGTCCESGECCGSAGDCKRDLCTTAMCQESMCDYVVLGYGCGSEDLDGWETCTGGDVCDGNGRCQTPATDCGFFAVRGGYNCSGEAPTMQCFTTCSAANEATTCTADGRCVDGACVDASLHLNGETCSGDAQCLSGHCRNGICCAGGDCCATSADCSNECRSATCNALFQCEALFLPCGTKDSDGTTTCDGASRCDGLGNCLPVRTCAEQGNVYATTGAIVCDNNVPTEVCRTSCTNSRECSAGALCNNENRCVLPNGQTCQQNDQCNSNHCVNGHCCASGECCGADTDCNDTCRNASCSPSFQCISTFMACGAEDTTGNSTCVGNNRCDGTGACKPTTTCADQGSLFTGLGTFNCTSGAPVENCRTLCTSDAHCVDGSRCNTVLGRCTARDGDACTSSSDCASNYCNQGICCAGGECCNTADDCNDACRTATCSAGHQCETAFIPCGDPDTFGPSQCSGNKRCDGTGNCRTILTCIDQGSLYRSDGGYTCVGGEPAERCLTQCTTSMDCLGNRRCNTNTGVCVEPGSNNGESCTDNWDCASDHCNNGICCAGGACCQNASDCNDECRNVSCTGFQCNATFIQCGRTDTTGATTCGGANRCDGAGQCQPVLTCAAKGSAYASDSTYTCASGQPEENCLDTCTQAGHCINGNVCHFGTGVCGLPDGAACTEDWDCASEYCQNGYCCDSGDCCATASDCGDDCRTATCDVHQCRYTLLGCGQEDTQGTFQCTGDNRCNGAGECASVTTCIDQGSYYTPSGQYNCSTGTPIEQCRTTCSNNSHCAPGLECNTTTYRCVAPDGHTCGKNSDCASNHCFNGVCCASGECCATADDCNDLCRDATCTAAFQCAPTYMPCGAADTDGTATCDGNKRCNGAGVCANVTTCSAQGDLYTGDGTYNCAGGIPLENCRTTCTDNSHCLQGTRCDNGACVPRLPNGNACTDADDCVSGHCNNGYCCASGECCASAADCSDDCRTATCNDSRCQYTFTPCGYTDSAGATTCGGTQRCDGAGNCAAVSTCADQDSAYIGTGTFNCASGAPVEVCRTTCTSDAHCRGGATCNTATQRCEAPNGSPCNDDADCGSNHCNNGLCCDFGACCNTPADCADDCRSVSCNNHSCVPTYWIPCGGTYSGMNSNCTDPYRCDGAGSCALATTCADLGNYASSGGFDCSGPTPTENCRTTCTDNTHCLHGTVCHQATGECRQPNGNTCADNDDCASGHCNNGHCCTSGVCCGSSSDCESTCRVDGACNPNTHQCALGPPLSCGAQDAAGTFTCTGDNRCDGQGACVPIIDYCASGQGLETYTCATGSVMRDCACIDDRDCDNDDLFCNGHYTCNASKRCDFTRFTADPCATNRECNPGECNEAQRMCTMGVPTCLLEGYATPCDPHRCVENQSGTGHTCVPNPRADYALCDDGDPCNGDLDYCMAGNCVSGPFYRAPCFDNDPCTDDLCSVGGGGVAVCNNVPMQEGDPCADEFSCYGDGVCRANPFVPGSPMMCVPSEDVCLTTYVGICQDVRCQENFDDFDFTCKNYGGVDFPEIACGQSITLYSYADFLTRSYLSYGPSCPGGPYIGPEAPLRLHMDTHATGTLTVTAVNPTGVDVELLYFAGLPCEPTWCNDRDTNEIDISVHSVGEKVTVVLDSTTEYFAPNSVTLHLTCP